MASKYHFISELYIKMIENNHLKLYFLLKDRLAPSKIYDPKCMQYVYNSTNYSLYDFPRIVCDHMIAEIQGVQIKEHDKEGNWYTIIEINEAREKFKDKEEVIV